MESREDRWFVRFRGHTLGPLTSEQVKISLGKKELGPEDKVASAREPSWRALSEFHQFQSFWESLSPSSSDFAPPPSPQSLWRKKKAPLPAAPIPSAATAEIAATKTPAHAPATFAAEEKNKIARSPAPALAKAALKKKKMPVKVKPRVRTRKSPAAAKRLPVSEPIPEKKLPQIILAAEPLALPLAPVEVAAAPAPAIQAAPEPEKSPAELAKETLSLLDSLREWSQREQEFTPRFRLDDHFPAKPPIPDPSPAPWVPPSTGQEPRFARSKKIELHLTLSKKFIVAFALIAALAVAAIVMVVVYPEKMRGLDSSRFPDPSSPTNELSSKNDPIPSLKAPTRPKRD